MALPLLIPFLVKLVEAALPTLTVVNFDSHFDSQDNG